MEADLLKVVGQIAGIGGLAIGALILIFRDIVGRKIFPRLPPPEAYRLLRLVVVATWSIAALGIAAWAFAPVRVATASAASCSPSIGNGNGDVKVICNISVDEKKATAESNLDIMLTDLTGLSVAQTAYLLPAFERYENDPTPDNWRLVVENAQRTKARLDAAINSAISYGAVLREDVARMPHLHAILLSRSSLLEQLTIGPPADPHAWAESYRNLRRDLAYEISELKKLVTMS